MSIHTVEIALPSGITIVEIRQGPAGTGGSSTWDSLTGTASQVPFEPVTPPAYVEGLVFYDTDDKSLVYYGDEPDVAMNIGRELWVRVRNDSGAPILNGKVVYINDAIGQLPTIRLARADSAVTSRVIGIATHDIGNNEFGYVTTVGEVKGLATNAYQDGDLLFLSAVTAGEMTTTAPLAPNRVIQVATVLHAHATQGKLYCHPETDSIPSTGIVDSTVTGRALITAADAAAARTTLALGAGDTPTFFGLNLIDGTTTTLNLYNLLSGGNTERLSFRWDTNVARIGTSKTGTGGPRDLVLETDGTERARISAAGAFGVTGTLTAGNLATGGTVSATGNITGNFVIASSSGAIVISGKSRLFSSLDGNLEAKAANGVSDSSFSCLNVTASGAVSATGIVSGSFIVASSVGGVGISGRSRWFSSSDGNLEARNASNTADSNLTGATITASSGVIVPRTSDATNFERVGMRWDSTTAKIGTRKGGTGVARDLVLEADGTERVRVLASNGNVGFGTTSPQQRLDVVGSIKASQPIFFPSYTVAQLQALTASAYTAAMAYCSDEADGPTMVFCDGTNWRRVQDRAIISTAP